jgi:hypothetical protein
MRALHYAGNTGRAWRRHEVPSQPVGIGARVTGKCGAGAAGRLLLRRGPVAKPTMHRFSAARVCRAARLPLSALAVLLLTAACTVRLISDYDEVFDQRVTSFQRMVDVFLVQAALGEGPEFADSGGFYAEAEAELTLLATRAAATPKNELTVQQVAALLAAFANVRKVHEQNRSNRNGWRAAAPIAQQAIDQICRAILTLELAKKRT